MKIVIDIPEEVFDEIYNKNYYSLKGKEALRVAVRNCTPLPKGHGRLIDADALEYFCEFEKCIQQTGIGCNRCQYHTITEHEIDTSPTIIEADKESEQE